MFTDQGAFDLVDGPTGGGLLDVGLVDWRGTSALLRFVAAGIKASKNLSKVLFKFADC